MTLKLVDIGESGRRAFALVCSDGICVTATDKDTAGHAMAVVLEALKIAKRVVPLELGLRVLTLLEDMPEVPGPMRDLCNGADTSVDTLLGYGYVRPQGTRHECGGALFDQARREAQRIDSHPVWLTDPKLQPH